LPGASVVGVLASSRMAAADRIEGVLLSALDPIPDLRGSLCEIHRDGWGLAPRPVQWDFITTRARVLRGLHVHRLRYDYLIVVQGSATYGLADLRRGSPSFRRSMVLRSSGEQPEVVIVPPGVAHGIYAHESMLYLYGLSSAYDGGDQSGCRFDDPALGIEWPDRNPILLPRDADMQSAQSLLQEFEEAGGVPEGL
jgi:dTDP-4-dehydrorhamnose 3,5-epimerase